MSARQYCRLRLRKREPVSFYMHTCTCFLDLPIEIRDKIYSEALVAPQSITVCSMTYDDQTALTREDDMRLFCAPKYIKEAHDPGLLSLSLNLFLTSVQIAEEAAAVFYRMNTFYFGGTEVWNPFYGWLNMIGAKNRASLRRVDLMLARPPELRTDSHGMRSMRRGEDYPFTKIISCGHEQDEDDRSEAHFIDPAIEACFRVLGKEGSGLRLKMLLQSPCLPGVNVGPKDDSDRTEDTRPWWSLEVPNFVERSRRMFSVHVNLIWVGRGEKAIFWQKTDDIRNKGWALLNTNDSVHPVRYYRTPKIWFTLRRVEC